jgi:hypothetical protein
LENKRRKLIKTGLSLPVFLTLFNRPAWGAARTMCTVSGFDSGIIQGGIVSGVDQNEICPDVHQVDFWINTPLLDADNNDVRLQSFNSTFGTNMFPDSTTLLDMLNSSMTKEKRFVSLYLDAYSQMNNFPLGTPADVVNIYNNNLTFFGDWTQMEADTFINYLFGDR